MKVLKVIFKIAMFLSGLFAVLSAMSFYGESVSLEVAVIILCLCVLVGMVSLAGYLTIEKIEDAESDWMALIKKEPKAIRGSNKAHKK